MRRRTIIVLKWMAIVWAYLMLSGCWNARELDQLAVVMAIGIDSVEDQYEVSVQIVDPSSFRRDSSMERSPTKVYTERDHSIFEVIRKITTQSSRKLYLAHMRFLVFDEETAKKGIREPLDQLFRDHEIRPDFKIAVIRNLKAKDALEFISPTESQPIMDMMKSLRTSERLWAPTSAVEVKDLMMRFTSSGIEPVLTGMVIKGNIAKGETLDNVKQPNSFSSFEFNGIGVFQDDRLAGWLNETESKAFTYIHNEVFNTVTSVKCPQSEGVFVIEIKSAQVDMIPQIIDRRPQMTIRATVDGNIGEVLCNVDLSDERNIQLFEQAATDSLETTLLEGIEAAQSYKSDIFGFGEAFHRQYPQSWRQWEEDWDSMFAKLNIKIDTRLDLRNYGKIVRPFENLTKKE